MGNRYMITGELKNSEKIISIQDNMFKICPRGKYRKADPHITIIPPFKISGDLQYKLQKFIKDIWNTEYEIQIEGAGVYPHLDNPRVILLDVTPIDELRSLRRKLVDWFTSKGIEFKYEPTPFHITLFKCDNGYTLAEDRKKLLQTKLSENRKTWQNSITDIVLEPL